MKKFLCVIIAGTLSFLIRENLPFTIYDILYFISLNGLFKFSGPGGVNLDNPRITEIGTGRGTHMEFMIYIDQIPNLNIDKATGYNMSRGDPHLRAEYEYKAMQQSWDFETNRYINIWTNHPLTGQCKCWNEIYEYTNDKRAYKFKIDIRREIRAHNNAL